MLVAEYQPIPSHRALVPVSPKIGRPSSFTWEKAGYILEQISEGRSLRSICAEQGMPSRPTVCRWLRDNTTFRNHYARARDYQADVYFEEIEEIASRKFDTMMELGAAKLRIDALKWMAGKLRPKVYGDYQRSEREVSVRINPSEWLDSLPSK